MVSFTPACTASPANRLLRGLIALFIGAFALASLDTPLIAILGGLAALSVLASAIWGWCLGTAAPDPLARDLTGEHQQDLTSEDR